MGPARDRRGDRAGPCGAAGRPPGRFALQAAIAALHAQAPTYEETDWRQILRVYDLLAQAWTSPVVALNRAVAVAMADGPGAGLAAIGELERDGRLAGYRYLPATKADLLRRLGRAEEAAQAYQAALELTANDAERSFLARRLTEVTGSQRAGPYGRCRVAAAAPGLAVAWAPCRLRSSASGTG